MIRVDLSVVVVSYNTKEFLLACLRSVEAHRGALKTETIVIDNASTDGSAEAVAAAFPETLLVRNDRNAGFAAAANEGLRRARGAILLLLNPDAEVRSGTLQAMAVFLREHPEAGAVGCRLVHADGTPQHSCSSFPNPLNFAVHAFLSYGLFQGRRTPLPWLQECWDHAATRAVDCVSGAALAIRREVLDEIGLLDERFFLYGEEKDLCWRIRSSGRKTFFLADAEAVHHGGASSRQNPDSIAQLQRGQVLFLRKHYGLLRRALLRAILAAGMLQKFVLFQALGLVRRSEEARNRALRYRRAVRFHFDPGYLPLDA